MNERLTKTSCQPGGAGVLSQSQVLLAFGVVAELFNGVRDAEPLDGELHTQLLHIIQPI